MRLFLYDKYTGATERNISALIDGALYLIHPDRWNYYAMGRKLDHAIPLEDFGITYRIVDGVVYGEHTADSTAQGNNIRKWNGSKKFSFTMPVRPTQSPDALQILTCKITRGTRRKLKEHAQQRGISLDALAALIVTDYSKKL